MLKTILIATDFSKPSRNASVYGLQLAKAMNAKVILFTAYQVSHPIAALNVEISRFGIMKQTEQKLADEANVIVRGEGPQIDIICDEGTAKETILDIAVEKGVDLIIMGMKGDGRNLKNLFGSTTISLIRDSEIPVLVVPEEVTFIAPKFIAYASDVFLDITIRAIDQIGWLTSFFNSKLFVVRVLKDSYEEEREKVNTPQNLRKELQRLSTTFNFRVNMNTTDGLNDFIKEQSIDLLIMSPHRHEWFERLLSKSETRNMIFHTHVPLLALPDKTFKETSEAIEAIENYRADQ